MSSRLQTIHLDRLVLFLDRSWAIHREHRRELSYEQRNNEGLRSRTTWSRWTSSTRSRFKQQSFRVVLREWTRRDRRLHAIERQTLYQKFLIAHNKYRERRASTQIQCQQIFKIACHACKFSQSRSTIDQFWIDCRWAHSQFARNIENLIDHCLHAHTSIAWNATNFSTFARRRVIAWLSCKRMNKILDVIDWWLRFVIDNDEQ